MGTGLGGEPAGGLLAPGATSCTATGWRGKLNVFVFVSPFHYPWPWTRALRAEAESLLPQEPQRAVSVLATAHREALIVIDASQLPGGQSKDLIINLTTRRHLYPKDKELVAKEKRYLWASGSWEWQVVLHHCQSWKGSLRTTASWTYAILPWYCIVLANKPSNRVLWFISYLHTERSEEWWSWDLNSCLLSQGFSLLLLSIIQQTREQCGISTVLIPLYWSEQGSSWYNQKNPGSLLYLCCLNRRSKATSASNTAKHLYITYSSPSPSPCFISFWCSQGQDKSYRGRLHACIWWVWGRRLTEKHAPSPASRQTARTQRLGFLMIYVVPISPPHSTSNFLPRLPDIVSLYCSCRFTALGSKNQKIYIAMIDLYCHK